MPFNKKCFFVLNLKICELSIMICFYISELKMVPKKHYPNEVHMSSMFLENVSTWIQRREEYISEWTTTNSLKSISWSFLSSFVRSLWFLETSVNTLLALTWEKKLDQNYSFISKNKRNTQKNPVSLFHRLSLSITF